GRPGPRPATRPPVGVKTPPQNCGRICDPQGEPSMSSSALRRAGLLLAGLFILTPLLAGEKEKVEYFKGKVVPLADLVARDGSKLDADAAPHSLVLVGDDGKTYFLVKDNGSRLFYKDSTLLNKPMRLTGRLLPASQLLRVFAVHSILKDQLHEV